MWGFHLPGFLPRPQYLSVLGLLGLGALLILASSKRALPAAVPQEIVPAGQQPAVMNPGRRLLRIGIVLGTCTAIFWTLRCRTQLLGDGIVWLAGIRYGNLPAESEPLSKAVWLGYAWILRQLHLPIAPRSLAVLPALCGAAAVLITWGIASELAHDVRDRLVAFGLLVTLGANQLFFGYIESYAVPATLVLAYIWLALRCIRGAGGPALPAGVLGLAIAAHFEAAYLTPSILLLGARGNRQWARGSVAALLAIAVAVTVALVTGSRPGDWVAAARIVEPSSRVFAEGVRSPRPYPMLSVAHGVDVVNAIFLVLPVPLLLLLSRFAALRPGRMRRDTHSAFLAVAALSGLLMTVALVLPLPAAQDWDVLSILLVPLGVLGVAVGGGLYAGPQRVPLQLGLAVMAASSLAAFVGVNADSDASERRFKVILGARAPITAFARAYGYGSLAEHYRNGGQNDSAAAFARRSVAEEPANPRFWAQAGTLLNGAGRYAEAIPYLEEATRRGGERAPVQNNLGISYTAIRQYASALDEFRAAVRLEPDNPLYRHSLALALLNCGQPDSARTELRLVLARWPGYRPARESYIRHFDFAGNDR
jgi:hypothetical protein